MGAVESDMISYPESPWCAVCDRPIFWETGLRCWIHDEEQEEGDHQVDLPYILPPGILAKVKIDWGFKVY